MAKIDKEKLELFETMPVNKALMKMAMPTIASQLINLVYNVVDTIYIGRVGNPYMTAAVTISSTVFFMTIALSNLLGIGGGSLISRMSGKGEIEKAESVCAFSFYASLGVSIIYSIGIGIFLSPLLSVLGASGNTIDFAKQYLLYVVIIGNVPVIMSAVMAHLLRNAGYSKQASIGLSGGGILNILLDPLFMFVIFPKGMEVTGAAVATLLSNVASFIYLLYAFRKVTMYSPLSMDPRVLKRLNKSNIKEVLSVGIPSALLPGLFDLANMFLNFTMAKYGDYQVAAIGMVMKAERIPTAINMGICQGMLPLIGYNFSSGNYKRMNKTIKTSRIWGIAVCVITILFYELMSKPVCSLFMKTAGTDTAGAMATIGFAVVFIRLRCLASPVQMLNFNTSYIMQAIGYGKGALIHTIVRELIVYVPMMVLMNYLFAEIGLVVAFPCSELIGAIFALMLFSKRKKRLGIEM